MPTNTGEAREIKDRASANKAEVVRESKNLARKVRADLKKEKKEKNEPADGYKLKNALNVMERVWMPCFSRSALRSMLCPTLTPVFRIFATVTE